ncbi:MAG TPA: NAD(P)-dependent oxidoreductase [Trebonia sp.]|jgi:3-hydroxyisobutyrate dehydrogenase-like beta-hydroxyacid dehydrogenase
MSIEDLPDIGVIGLGAMGSRMTRRLLAAGYRVHGWNRSSGKAAALEADGLIAWPTPRQVAGHARIIVSMVWNSAALLDVTRPPDGLLAGLTPEHVLIDMSTVEPEVAAGVSGEAAARGAATLGCPVSGSLDAAESGNLVILAGGPAAALERVRPVLGHLARQVIHLGDDVRLGLTLKLAVNLQVAVQAVAWGEGLLIAERAGLSRAAATEAMLASVIASPMLRYRAPFVLRQPDEVWASAAQLRKDVAYATGAAGGAEALPAGQIALALLDAVCGCGEADAEAGALARFVADRRHLEPAVKPALPGKGPRS